MCYCELWCFLLSSWWFHHLNIVNAFGIMSHLISLKVICKCYFSLWRKFVFLGVGDLRYAHLLFRLSEYLKTSVIYLDCEI